MIRFNVNWSCRFTTKPDQRMDTFLCHEGQSHQTLLHLSDMTLCSPDASWMLFLGDGGSRSWLRNSPSCSSAISVLTLRDKQPGFISGRLTSPDSSRLRATSAKHISYKAERELVTQTSNHTFLFQCKQKIVPTDCFWALCCWAARLRSPTPACKIRTLYDLYHVLSFLLISVSRAATFYSGGQVTRWCLR